MIEYEVVVRIFIRAPDKMSVAKRINLATLTAANPIGDYKIESIEPVWQDAITEA
jgi:hypothetical protein